MVVVAGLGVEAVVGLLYVLAARAVSRRRQPWPWHKTAAFLAGIAAMALVLQSGFDDYADDVFWAHLVQHVVLMSVAPLLLALGAPVTLALQALTPASGRQLVGVLHSRPIRAIYGRPTPGHLLIEYYGLMFLYLLTPAAGLAGRHEAFHVATHAVFFLCGLLFWVPIIGADPVGRKPSQQLRVALVLAGIPVNAALAITTGSWAVLWVTEAATLLGLVVVLGRRRHVPVHEPTVVLARGGAVRGLA